MINPDWGYALRLQISPLLTEDFTKVASAFLRPEEPIPTWDERNAGKQLQPEDLPAEKERIRKGHIAPDTTSFPKESPAMANAYREMLALCRERGWNAVLVTPPYTAEYCECFEEYSADYFSVLERFMDGLTEEYGAPWLDFSRDPAFSRRYDLFMDIDHLNQEGAALFNEKFWALVRSQGLIP